MIPTIWRCAGATQHPPSFVLSEGRLWFSQCMSVNGVMRARAEAYTYIYIYIHIEDWGSSPVCPPFVILSEANHVRQRVYLCMQKIVETEMPILKSGVLWKYCFVHARKSRDDGFLWLRVRRTRVRGDSSVLSCSTFLGSLQSNLDQRQYYSERAKIITYDLLWWSNFSIVRSLSF